MNITKVSSNSDNIYPNYLDTIILPTHQLTILEFWYTSCLPCSKLVPILNKIKLKYGEQISIYGINLHEYEEKYKYKIENYLKRTPMDFPIMLASQLPMGLEISVFPTIIIINKENEVLYTKSGFSNELQEEIEAIIDHSKN